MGPGTATPRGRPALCCPPRRLGRETSALQPALCKRDLRPTTQTGPTHSAVRGRRYQSGGAGSRLASPTPDACFHRSRPAPKQGHAPRWWRAAKGRCQARRGAGCPAPAGPAGNQPGCQGTQGRAWGSGGQCAPPGPAPLRGLSSGPVPTPRLAEVAGKHSPASPAEVRLQLFFPIRPQTLPWRKPSVIDSSGHP